MDIAAWDSKAVLRTLRASMQGQNSNRAQKLQGHSDIPVTSSGKKGRPVEGAVEHRRTTTVVLDKRCKRDALRAAFAAEKEGVKEHAQ